VRETLILATHLLVTLAKLLRPGGARAVAAESLLLKHQRLISNCSRPIWRESWGHSGLATTSIACTARPVPLPPRWIATVGGGTAGAPSSSRSPTDYEFATDSRKW